MNRLKLSEYLFPRLRDIFFIVIFLAVLLLGQQMLNMDGDLPRHLLTGKYFLETVSIPDTELFVYPYQGLSYVSHEWLAQVALYLAYKVAGLAGIVLLSAILLATTFSIIYSATSSRFKLYLPVLFLVLWGAGVTSLNWITRPHLFSMLFLAIWLIWVDKLARGEKIPVWYFLIGIIIWSNTHGEFVIGILVLVAYAAGWMWDYLFDREKADIATGKKIFIVLVLSTLASGINPAGFESWVTMFGFVGNDYMMSRMFEARSPDFHQPGFLVLLGLLSFSFFLLALNRKKLGTNKSFLLVGFSAMSLLAARNVHFYGIVAPFILAETLQGTLQLKLLARIERRLFIVERKLKGIVLPVMLIIIFLFSFSQGNIQKHYRFDPETFPVHATEWLLENPQEGRMFNNLDWGGYLEWKLWPTQSVFIDSMADTTGEITRQYESVITLSDSWDFILTDNQVDWAIIPSSSSLADALRNASWKVLFEDETAIILKRE